MNKRLSYICLFSLLFFHRANARSISIVKDSGLYLSFSGCSSIPLGYFKSSKYFFGGNALNGFGGDIGMEHPIKPGWIGLAFETGYYVNSFNLPAYKNVMYPLFNQYPTWEYTFIDASQYKEIPVLVGMFSKSTFKKFTIEVKSMIGVDIVTPALVNVVQIATNKTIGFYPELFSPLPHATNAFYCYYLEVSSRYVITNHVYLKANAGYLNDFYAKYPYFSNSLPYIPLAQLHLELGIEYHF